MNNLLISFEQSLQALGISPKDRLLLAVSGGMDSVILADCCAALNLNFGIAHMNFQLRGNESERDERFVSELAMKYGCPIYIKKTDTHLITRNERLSIQETARVLRYDWFKTFLGTGDNSYQFILTAHHLNDQTETMLMHFFRGTGIGGLTGIPEKNGRVVRPFLHIPKKELTAFANARHLTWVEDSSNDSDHYTRNYFRNQLIPSLTKIFPGVQTNLEKNITRFNEASVLYQQAIDFHRKKLVKVIGNEMHLPILLLKKSIPLQTILFEIIKEYNFTSGQLDDVIHLMDASNGKYVYSSSHRIIRNRSWLIIAALEEPSPDHLVIDEDQIQVKYPGGTLQIKQMSGCEIENVSAINTYIEHLDADHLRFPLQLRKWRSGDYFYPLGMKKKKKLARFFIDQKLSKTAKEKIWVLISDKHIICVIGHRIDDRFKVGSTTRRMLQLKNEVDEVRS